MPERDVNVWGLLIGLALFIAGILTCFRKEFVTRVIGGLMCLGGLFFLPMRLAAFLVVFAAVIGGMVLLISLGLPKALTLGMDEEIAADEAKAAARKHESE